jgi:hypothetical protein
MVSSVIGPVVIMSMQVHAQQRSVIHAAIGYRDTPTHTIWWSQKYIVQEQKRSFESAQNRAIDLVDWFELVIVVHGACWWSLLCVAHCHTYCSLKRELRKANQDSIGRCPDTGPVVVNVARIQPLHLGAPENNQCR